MSSTGFFKKRLTLKAETEMRVVVDYDLHLSMEEFAIQSPLCIAFLALTSSNASFIETPTQKKMSFLPLDHRYNLNEIEEYLVRRFWDRYMELQMAIDMGRELSSMPFATAKDSALDIQRHLEATPKTEGRGNKGFMIEDMRNGIRRTVERSRWTKGRKSRADGVDQAGVYE